MPTVPSQFSASQAIAKAKATSRWAVGMCDQFVAQMYGYNSSGYATALTNWTSTPANLKHPQDMNAPAGALMYWGGANGHVAISTGDGNIVSTDIGGMGTVTTVPANSITAKWGKPYLGWTYPYFQGHQATNTLGSYTGSTPVGTPVGNAQQAAFGVNADSLTSGFINAILTPFKGLINTAIWGAETLTGMALLGLGIYIIVRNQ